jgi:hypothetical protein
MTKSRNTHLSHIDIHEVLEQRGQVAVIWCIEDVQEIRPDLSDAQAWDVLQTCKDRHDCTLGFTWTFIELIAEEIFPEALALETCGKGA